MILVIDFGSQYNQLIARRVREHRVYCQIEPPTLPVSAIRDMAPRGIILSGGPASIYEENSPGVDPGVFDLGIPVLGICYGMQYMIHSLGGEVAPADKREYGLAELTVDNPRDVLDGVPERATVWMSHGDSIKSLPEGFTATARTDNTPFAAVAAPERGFYGLQFHPEVTHTPKGKLMLKNFLTKVCGCKQNWTMKSFVKESVAAVREAVGDDKVILGLSGGVDSSVAAVLLHRAVGDNLTPIFVDNGLLRLGEAERLRKVFADHLHVPVRFVDARREFLSELAGVEDPERKRKIIGRVFMEVFEAEAKKIEGVKYIAQGTLYPDIIESVSAWGGPTAVIKSHHNVGGLPEKMELSLVEPLKYLFKDEVRKVGRELGLPDDMVWRQPFPGPGLAIRVIGAVDEQRLEVLRKVDAVITEEIRAAGYYKKVWQSFPVLLPIRSVGIMGDQRTYENVIAIRAVTSRDAMTADWARLPHSLLARISNRVINEIRGVNRVVYDISSKPPSTIEWE
ncbi:MAG: glutamine-hydrolyzing GMP synthase [Desulfatibacillaceae bacterium]